MKTILQMQQFKDEQKKITMVTCYDYWSARILSQSDVDCLLVGDSVSMVVHGFDSTVHATVDMMATHTAAVARAKTDKLIIADLPFLSHRKGTNYLMENVDQLMKAGAGTVKIETAPGQEDMAGFIADSGVPVIGHVGLTPQFVHQFGGYKVQGKSEEAQDKILKQSLELQKRGCSALVLECVPTSLGKMITEELSIPTIGIGAGPYTNGQVLVLQDLLGFNSDFKPRFVRQFAQGQNWMDQAMKDFTSSVEDQSFPKPEESFQ
ncbi:MAG: 3-methyl-2-oxobutanoate hydroxymethyltransferase [Bdellovibrionales bacterium]|nr:3-methyl-2-oxobutanoate hydroxymethyltransferase [Bdellovibrionales bacterium]NQZ18049.1 3-methyl-2-oxobutanoate hydroxymethyltransferase [Bdellovibrionales bacterium]